MKANKMMTRLLTAMCVSTMLLGASTQAADVYPTRPIELIVPYSAGGGTDLLARAFADTAKKYLPQAIGVVNKVGGGGAVGLTEVAFGRPDGYKIGTGNVELSMLPHMGIVKFVANDFVPIALLNAEPSAISVNGNSPWKTYEEFMANAKANPGKVRIGHSGTGAIWHLAAEALTDKTGVKFNNVAYDGANPAVTALLGNHVDAVTVSPPEVLSHVRAGTIRLLAVMSDKRQPTFPDVPTLKEKGVDLTVLAWRGIVAPKKTPQNIVDVLSSAVKKTAEDPAFKTSMDKMNMSLIYLDAAEYKKLIEKDNAYFKALMTKLGIAK